MHLKNGSCSAIIQVHEVNDFNVEHVINFSCFLNIVKFYHSYVLL